MGARSAMRRLCTWIHAPSRRGSLVEHGIVLPSGRGGAEVDTHPAGCEPPIMGMRLTGGAPRHRRSGGTGELGGGGLVIGKMRGQRDGRSWLPATGCLVLVGLPPGLGGRGLVRGALSRRICALPNGATTTTWDREGNNGPPPAQRHPHHQSPSPARVPSPTNRQLSPRRPRLPQPTRSTHPSRNSLSPPRGVATTDGKREHSSISPIGAISRVKGPGVTQR